MKTFTLSQLPFGLFVVEAGGDPLVAYAEKDNGDRHGERLAYLVQQANTARELADSLNLIVRELREAYSFRSTLEVYVAQAERLLGTGAPQ